MKRFVSVLFLCGLVFSGQAYGMSDSGKQQYLDWLKTIGGSEGALAVAPGGCWAAEPGLDTYSAKRKALRRCKNYCKKTCEIKDVNGISYFIKQSGSSSSSKASSSSKIWCATKYFYRQMGKTSCLARGGKSYSSESQANREHQRLHKTTSVYSSTASSSSSKLVWCATKYFYRQMRKTSCLARGGKSYSSESQANREHQRLYKTTSVYSSTASSSSSKLVWCVTKYFYGKQKESTCKDQGGKSYSSEYQAKAEHKRLNKSSSASGTLVWCGKSFKLSCSSSSSSSTASSSSSSLVWCATKNWWRYTKESSCRSARGKIHPSEYQAKAAHKRLKSGSSSYSTASSSSKIWCATKYSVSQTSNYSCKQNKGKVFNSYSSALAERVRLNKSSSSSSSTASSSSTNWVWCLSTGVVDHRRASSCKAMGGKSYSSEHQAKAEHKRLKTASTPNVKTASLTIRSNVTGDKVYIDGNFKGSTRLDLKLSKGRHTIRIEKDGYKTYEESINLTDNLIIRGHLEKIVDEPVQTVVVDNTVEVEFWNSIKGSDDPDEYRIYLDEYPTGKFAKLAKLRIKKLGGTVTSVAQSSIPNLDYGDYYALVIGNNRYQHLKPLSTAVNDANAVASLLRSRYQFNVNILTNATRSETVSALSMLRKTISSKDNLLIYYAGHGWLDKEMDEGFWLPVDAVDDDQVDWIANDTIMRSVRAIKAKHVMVVADACFSGTLTRGITIKKRSPDYIKQIVQKKARTALSSGGIELVTDVGGGNHSIFAATFMRILNENTGVLDGHQLFTTLRKQVMMNADQTPEYGDIRKAGHDGGDFLFVRQ